MSGVQQSKGKSVDALGADGGDASLERFQEFKRAHPEWYYQVPEGGGIGEMLTRPWHLTRFYFVRLFDQFGWRFITLMACTFFGIKGFLYTLIYTAMFPYFIYHLNVAAIDYQIYGTIAGTPWSMKALMGACSDVLPIRGFHKKYYIVLFAFIGTACWLGLGFVNLNTETGWIAAILFFLANFQCALSDLMVQGRYAELMVKNPETSSDLVSWVWATYFVGGLLATWIVGPLADKYEEDKNYWWLRGMFFAAVPFAIQIVIPVMMGWLGELPLPASQRGFQGAKWRRHKYVFLLAILMGLGALGSAVMSLMNNLYIRKNLPAMHQQLPVLVYVLVATLALTLCSYRWLPRGCANALFYMMITDALYVSISGPMDVFFTAGEKCVPGGPAFDAVYYITWSQTVSSVMGVVGVALFQAVMSEWEFRPCFWVSSALQAAAGIIDLIIVNRWNISVGIPDKWMFMLGYNIVFQIVGMLNFMPGVVLISKLCPKGMESTLYALLAGFANFGKQVSRFVGVYLISIFDISMVRSGPCRYGNLSWLIVTAHIALPALCVPLTFLLLPKARLTDPFLPDEFHAKFDDGNDDTTAVELVDGREQADKK